MSCNCGCGSQLGAYAAHRVLPSRVLGPLSYNRYVTRARALSYFGLGFLGETTTTGVVASKGAGLAAGAATTGAIGTAAGTAGGAVFGASAGSVVPVIGTVVGAVVGILVAKLFGHANYQQIANDVASQMKVAELYKQVYGQYAGRDITVPDLQLAWKGLLHEGVFPKNWGGGSCNIQACTTSPSKGACNNCGGNESWVMDLFSGNVASPATRSFNGAIATAAAQGIVDPVRIADEIFIPAWSGPDKDKFNIQWAYPGNSTQPAVVRQLIIDTLDALQAQKNPNLARTYGGTTAKAPATSAGAPTPPVSAPPPTASGVPINTSGGSVLSPDGTTIKAGSGQSIVAGGGVTWTFQTDGTITRNGIMVGAGPPRTGSGPGTLVLSYQGGQIIAANNDGKVYQWDLTGNGWKLISGAAPASPVPAQPTAPMAGSTPALSPEGSMIKAGSGLTLTTAAGVWGFGSGSDGSGNSIVTLNGTPLQTYALQLAILQGQLVALKNDGSTWTFSPTQGWSQLTPPVTAPAQPTAQPPVPSLYPTNTLPPSGGGGSAGTYNVPTYTPPGSASPSVPTAVSPAVASAGISSIDPTTLAIFGGVVLLGFAFAKPSHKRPRSRARFVK